MAFTYDFSGADAGIAQLRMMISDNVEETAFLQDDEIAFILLRQPNVNRAAADACRSIAARLAREAGFKNTTVIYDPTEKAKEYRMLAKEFDEIAQRESSFDLVMTDQTSDLSIGGLRDTKPAFTRNLHFTGGYTE